MKYKIHRFENQFQKFVCLQIFCVKKVDIILSKMMYIYNLCGRIFRNYAPTEFIYVVICRTHWHAMDNEGKEWEIRNEKAQK